MENRNQTLVRIVVGIGIALFIFFGAMWVYRYLTTGKITMSTNDKTTYVRVNKVIAGGDSEPIPIAEGTKKLSTRVKPGSYVLTAFSPLSSTSKTIHVEARQHIATSLNLPVIGPVTPVYGDSITDPVAGNSRILFIDSGGHLTEINSQNQVRPLDGSHLLKSAQWINTSLGAAQDREGNFYSIVSGELSLLPSPFQANRSPSASYAISPNGTIYLSNGQSVFRGGSTGFSQVYSSGNNYNVALAATNTGVAIIEKNSGTDESSVVVVTRNGQTHRQNVSASSIAWSRDGKYLGVAGGTGSNIFSGSLQKVASIPQNGATNLMWGKDNILFYTAGNQLSAYNMTAKQGSRIANIPNNGGIDTVSLSDDLSYVYIVARQRGSGEGNGTNQLFRIGLTGQVTPKNLRALSTFLPEDIGVCSLNYINFTAPTIIVRYPQERVDPERCMTVAKSELKYYDVNPNSFDFAATPYIPQY